VLLQAVNVSRHASDFGPRVRPEGPKPEAQRADSWVGFLERGKLALSPPMEGLGERCKLPQRGSGHSFGR